MVAWRCLRTATVRSRSGMWRVGCAYALSRGRGGYGVVPLRPIIALSSLAKTPGASIFCTWFCDTCWVDLRVDRLSRCSAVVVPQADAMGGQEIGHFLEEQRGRAERGHVAGARSAPATCPRSARPRCAYCSLLSGHGEQHCCCAGVEVMDFAQNFNQREKEWDSFTKK